MTDWAWIEPLLEGPLGGWLERLPRQVETVWRERPHGDQARWREAIAKLPCLSITACDLDSSRVTAGRTNDCTMLRSASRSGSS